MKIWGHYKMPIHQGKDSAGSFYQWGNHGKKYYYTCCDKKSRDAAKAKAGKQAQAAYSHGWREKK